MNWSALQKENAAPFKLGSLEDIYESLAKEGKMSDVAARNMMFLEDAQVSDSQVRSPILESSRGKDYWGNSFFDNDIADESDWAKLGDIRAENQPWYSKILNGTAKGAVLAATTAAETVGLAAGLVGGFGAAAQAKDGEGWKEYWHFVWDNPITQALKAINDKAEEWMPNYYTEAEREGAFDIFSANFLGDKIIKNFGFMVGAFYGGIPLSYGAGKVGINLVKNAQKIGRAKRYGMATRVRELERLAARDGLDINDLLKANKLTPAERALAIKKIGEDIDKFANSTRTATQWIGALGSAFTEGAVEAINNASEWVEASIQAAEIKYNQDIAEIERLYGDTMAATEEKLKRKRKFDEEINEINLKKASVGNADLLWNIPVLMFSNFFELGNLYARGFDSTRRQLGTFLKPGLGGSAKDATLKSTRTKGQAFASAFLKTNTEGVEEMAQRMVSDMAGNAANESIRRYLDAGNSEHAQTTVSDYLMGFSKSLADNLGNPQAWEEYFIGAASAAIGMPVFGSQTKNAYLGRNRAFGLAGGLYGNYDEFLKARDRENDIANYLNQRVKDPNNKMVKLWKNLQAREDYDQWLMDEMAKGDKSKYKDLELEKFYRDLDAMASSGHLAEFKELLGFGNDEYSDEELQNIIDITKVPGKTAADQKNEDEAEVKRLTDQKDKTEDKEEKKKLDDQIKDIQARISKNDYKDIDGGPFIDTNGPMNVYNREGMVKKLNENKKKLLEGIDNYLAIRNQIDIETNGTLSNEHIGVLTGMRAHILDYEMRTDEMALQLVENLPAYINKKKQSLNELQQRIDKLNADIVAEEGKDKPNKTTIDARKADIKAAEEDRQNLERLVKFLDSLMEHKNLNEDERKAIRKYTKDPSLETERGLNAEELQQELRNPEFVLALAMDIDRSDVSPQIRKNAIQALFDLSLLAKKKVEYREALDKFLGKEGSINEAFRNERNAIAKEQLDKEIEKVTDRFVNASTIETVDKIMREVGKQNSELAYKAFDKAVERSSGDKRSMLEKYKKAYMFMKRFQSLLLHSDASPFAIESINRFAVEDGFEGGEARADDAVTAWEYAITQDDIEGSFMSKLEDEVIERRKAPESPVDYLESDKYIADVLEGVLSKLKEAEKHFSESAHTTKGPSSKKDTGEKKVQNTKENALNVVRKKIENHIKVNALKKTFAPVKAIDALPTSAKSKVEEWNKNNEDKITDKDISDIFEELYAKYLNNQSSNSISEEDMKDNDETDDGYRGGSDNEQTDEMKATLSSTFTNDMVSQFLYGFDYRDPYNPTDTDKDREAFFKEVQKVLLEHHAYDFVNLGLLAKLVAKAQEKSNDLKIHFLRSTDSGLNNDKFKATFLAVEYPRFDASEEMRAFSKAGNVAVIDGKRFIIVGAMAYESTAPEWTKKSFWDLQAALSTELDGTVIEDAAKKGQKFVISKKTTVIDTMFTGRLDKRNNEEDYPSKVSLYEWMTKQADADSPRLMPDFDKIDVYFAPLGKSGDSIPRIKNVNADQQVNPSDVWASRNKGAVLLYVQKPDGKYYYLRCTKRTVDEWLDGDNGNGQTGQQILDAVLKNESGANPYIKTLVSYLKTISDSKQPMAVRTRAKEHILCSFNFRDSTISFSEGGDVTVTIANKDDANKESKSFDFSNDEDIQGFFDFLGEKSIKFSLELKNDAYDVKDSKDIIKSGIFTIGMRGFYNFNASFTIKPIDKDGNVVELPRVTFAKPLGGPAPLEKQLDLKIGSEKKTYIVKPDGTVLVKVDDSTVKEVENRNEAEVVRTIRKVQENFGGDSAVKTLDIHNRYSGKDAIKDSVKDKLAEMYANVYCFTVNGEVWILDTSSGDYSDNLYKLRSPRGENLIKRFYKDAQSLVEKALKNPETFGKGKKEDENKKAFEEGSVMGSSFSGTRKEIEAKLDELRKSSFESGSKEESFSNGFISALERKLAEMPSEPKEGEKGGGESTFSNILFEGSIDSPAPKSPTEISELPDGQRFLDAWNSTGLDLEVLSSCNIPTPQVLSKLTDKLESGNMKDVEDFITELKCGKR